MSREKSSIGSMINTTSTKIIFSDTSWMVVYDPRQKSGFGFMPNAPAPSILGVPAVSVSISSSNVGSSSGGSSNALDEILKVMAPTLMAFMFKSYGKMLNHPTMGVTVFHFSY